MSDEIDMLCERCGQTFSAFLHEMADKNAKVLCPKCQSSRDCDSPKAAEPVTGARSVRRIS
jgi:DNA-directed RNA polymerase subunit RPC12/RpoP